MRPAHSINRAPTTWPTSHLTIRAPGSATQDRARIRNRPDTCDPTPDGSLFNRRRRVRIQAAPTQTRLTRRQRFRRYAHLDLAVTPVLLAALSRPLRSFGGSDVGIGALQGMDASGRGPSSGGGPS